MEKFPDTVDLRHFRQVAEEIIRATRFVAIDGVRSAQAHGFPPDRRHAIDVDFQVEQMIRSRLRAALPEHRIFGRQQVRGASGSDYEWIVDPLNGAGAVEAGLPLAGISLALRHRGEPVLGLIDLPTLDRAYAAARGQGATCNGEPLSLADTANRAQVAEEVVAVGGREWFVRVSETETFDRLMRPPHPPGPCDRFGHALVIEGSVAAMVDYGLRIWDVAAMQVIVREAGGRYERLATAREPESYDVVFGKPSVVEWVIKRLQVSAHPTGSRWSH